MTAKATEGVQVGRPAARPPVKGGGYRAGVCDFYSRFPQVRIFLRKKSPQLVAAMFPNARQAITT